MSDLRTEELILGAMAEVFEDLADKSKKSLKAYIDKNHDDAKEWLVYQEDIGNWKAQGIALDIQCDRVKELRELVCE